MDEFSRQGWVDTVIAELAARQHGLVTRRQLLERGIGRGAIDVRIRRKRLHPVHHAVYALSPAALERLARWMAAVLAAGEGAVLSHWSAASHWRMRPGTGPRSHVTSRRRKRSRPEITFHHADLREDEVTEEQAIPVTTPARTLLDLAPLLPSPVLARMMEAAPHGGTTLAELLGRYPRRAGVPKLRRIVATPQPMTRSDFEATLLDAMRRAGLPQPEVNASVEGYEVDFLWREHGVVAEADSYLTHGSQLAFERDRARDRRLTAAGWRVVRLTNEGGIADLSRLLAASGAHARRRHAQAA